MTDFPDNPLFETVKRLQRETDQKGERIQVLQDILTRRNARIAELEALLGDQP